MSHETSQDPNVIAREKDPLGFLFKGMLVQPEENAALIEAVKAGSNRRVKQALKRFSPNSTFFIIHTVCGYPYYTEHTAPVLSLAAERGNMSVLKTLIEAGAQVNPILSERDQWSYDKCLTTPVHGAIESGKVDVLHFLVQHGASLKLAHQYYSLPHRIVALCKNPDLLSYVLDNGISPNDGFSSDTPLHIVMRNLNGGKGRFVTNYRYVQILLAHGADPSVKNVLGNTPLDELAGTRKGAILQRLFRRNIMRRVCMNKTRLTLMSERQRDA